MSGEHRDEPVVVVERGGSGGQVAAFLIGIAIGAGAALLFAPQSGAETRADLVRQARRARRGAERFARTVRDKAEDAIEDVKTRVETGRDAGKAAARAARDELTRRFAEARTEQHDGEDA